MFVNRSYGAYRRALAAEGASPFAKSLLVRRAYFILVTAMGRVDRPDGLDFLTRFNTAPALYAFAHIADKGFAFNHWLVVFITILFK
jgi:hypothetical protein